MSKIIQFTCSPEIKTVICKALEIYIDSAFPKEGCADCSLVAREELLNAVKGINASYTENGIAQYNKRIRAFVTEAIKLYFELEFPNHPDRDKFCVLITRLSRGENLTCNEMNELAGFG